MTILKVRHITSYAYKRPVGFGEHRILFRPRDRYDQRLLQAELSISPQPSDVHWIHDVFGNCVAVANFDTKATSLRFETNTSLDHTPQLGPHFRAEKWARLWPFDYDAETLPDLLPSIERQYPDDGGVTEAWARRFLTPTGKTDTANLL